MGLSKEQLKTELESYLKKLVGVMPIGHYWFGIDPKSKPAGVQIYAGQILSRNSYPKHWEFVSSGHRTVISEAKWKSIMAEQGFCPYYSYGDGSTTYRMPLVKGVHPKFVSTFVETGGYTEAGLPNITGYMYGLQTYTDAPAHEGALYPFSDTRSKQAALADTDGANSIGIDASRSNSIYGNSDTVQPEAINILIGEYVIGSVSTIEEANAESLLASVTQLEAGKLETSGGYISGDLSIGGDIYVSGQINASISGTSENAVKASQDSQGRVINLTYATKDEILDVVRSVNGNTANENGEVTITIPATPKAYVTATYKYGNNGYRKYSDGFIEQWGRGWNPTFPVAFSNTNYGIVALTTKGWGYAISITGKTTTKATFTQWQTAAGGEFTDAVQWYACGF